MRAAGPKPVAASGGAGSRRPTMPSTRWLAIRTGQKSVVCERVGGGHSQERASAGRSCIWRVLRWRLGRVGSAEVSIGAREGQAGSTERLAGHPVMLLLRSASSASRWGRRHAALAPPSASIIHGRLPAAYTGAAYAHTRRPRRPRIRPDPHPPWPSPRSLREKPPSPHSPAANRKHAAAGRPHVSADRPQVYRRSSRPSRPARRPARPARPQRHLLGKAKADLAAVLLLPAHESVLLLLPPSPAAPTAPAPAAPPGGETAASTLSPGQLRFDRMIFRSSNCFDKLICCRRIFRFDRMIFRSCSSNCLGLALGWQ